MKQNTLVSIVVPTFDRHELLVDTLKGLLIQEYEPKEIIVYDQSLDHPPDVINFLKSVSPRIQYYKNEPRGLVFAYRRCVELSQGDICFFVDDDVLIDDPDLVTRHVKNYTDGLIGAVTGQVLHEGQTEPSPVDERIYGPHGWRFIRFDISQRLEGLPSLSGANMSFRRSVYDRIGGFDQNFEGNGFRFETDFAFAVKSLGFQVIFDPEASLTHRYCQPGGAANRHLCSLQNDSHHWYMQFFANTWYFLLKWYKMPTAARLIFSIWREHTFNRNFLRCGSSFLLNRQWAFISGIRLGQKRAAGWSFL